MILNESGTSFKLINHGVKLSILKYNTTTVARGTKVDDSDLTKLMKRGL